MSVSCARVLSAIAVPFALAIAQEPSPGPQPGPASPGPTSPGTATPGRPTSPFPGRDPQQPTIGDPSRTQFPEMQRPIFLSGKVMMEDGTPPPDSATIERVCNGQPRPEGYTDSKGGFSIQLGQNSHVMPDASVSSASDGFDSPTSMGGRRPTGGGGFGGQQRVITERDLVGCELRANLAGFRSDSIQLAGRRIMDNPNVGTIVLHRLGNVEGFTTSATSMLAPKDAKKAFDKGRDAARKKKWDDAQKELEKAVAIYPKYAVAWADLGRVYEVKDDVANARKAYEQALAADSKLVTPYVQMAGIQAREAKWQEVAETTDTLIRLNPINYPIAYFYNSIANVNLQKFDAAEKSALEAKKLAPNLPKVDHVLGVIYANKNDYESAARHMKAYIAAAPNAGDIETVKKQLAEVEKTLGARGGASPPQP